MPLRPHTREEGQASNAFVCDETQHTEKKLKVVPTCRRRGEQGGMHEHGRMCV